MEQVYTICLELVRHSIFLDKSFTVHLTWLPFLYFIRFYFGNRLSNMPRSYGRIFQKSGSVENEKLSNFIFNNNNSNDINNVDRYHIPNILPIDQSF